jgi:hypothetical protein
MVRYINTEFVVPYICIHDDLSSVFLSEFLHPPHTQQYIRTPMKRKQDNRPLLLALAGAVVCVFLYRADNAPPGRPTLRDFHREESQVEPPSLTGIQRQFIAQAEALSPPDLSAADSELLKGAPSANILLARWLENYFNVSNDVAVRNMHPAHRREILNVWGILSPFGLKDANREPKWADLPMLSSEIVQDCLLEWSLPLIEQIWKQDANNDYLRETLDDLRAFVQSVDIEKEKAYMAQPNNAKFVRFDANGNRRGHAKLEAFMLRRICHGDITRERFIVLLDRIILVTKQWDQSLEKPSQTQPAQALVHQP